MTTETQRLENLEELRTLLPVLVRRALDQKPSNVTDESQRTVTSSGSQAQHHSMKRSIDAKPSISSRKRRKGTPIKIINDSADGSDDDDIYDTYGPLQAVTPVPAQSPSQCVLYAASHKSPTLPYEPAHNLKHPDANGGSLNAMPQDVDNANEDRLYTCSWDGCTMQFVGFKAFDAHSIQQHNRYACRVCEQLFTMRQNRNRHISTHNGDKPYQCPDCRKPFSRADTMRDHRLTHTLSYQQGRCRHCGQEYNKKKELMAHLKSCFRQHRTKSGSIDENLFDNLNASINGNTMQNAASGLLLAGIKLGNNNEPTHPFLMRDANCLAQQSSFDPALLHASVAAFNHTLRAIPAAHTDFVRTSPELAQALSSKDIQSPLDLSNHPSKSHVELANCNRASPIDHKSKESDMKLVHTAANNITEEKPIELPAAPETLKDTVSRNRVPSVPMLAATSVDQPY